MTHDPCDSDGYKRAAKIAYYAMGKDKRGDSEAVNDPLAWWCLTEWIARVRTSGPSMKSGKQHDSKRLR